MAGRRTASSSSPIADARAGPNALLIFDEIETGFRYPARQRAEGDRGHSGSDLPRKGARVGDAALRARSARARNFLDFFHKTHFCPTFRGEVYSLAAARAALEIYRTEPVADHIWAHGESLRRGIQDACRHAGVDGECTGAPFHLLFVFREPDPIRRRWKRTLLMQELLREGIFTVSGMMLPSYAHDDEVLQRAVAAYGQAFELIAHADRRGDLPRYIELPLL